MRRINYLLSRLVSPIRAKIDRYRAAGKTKYFCIGRNKTGTTSLKKAFKDLEFPVGDQRTAELLSARYYFNGNFEPIIKYCESAQVFQDIPFSWAETLKYLDHAYPGSKFILTIRNDAAQWYDSIRKFHAKKFGHGQIPTADDLRLEKYVDIGFMYKAIKLHGTPDDDLYNKEIMEANYLAHNQAVINYFKDRPDDLLVINLAEKGAYQRFCGFLCIDNKGKKEFPWENKT